MADGSKGRVIGIVAAAGSGERMGGVQKAFTPLLGREMVAYSLQIMQSIRQHGWFWVWVSPR